MKSRYEKEINEYLKSGGTINQNNSGVTGVDDMAEGKLLQESITAVSYTHLRAHET